MTTYNATVAIDLVNEAARADFAAFSLSLLRVDPRAERLAEERYRRRLDDAKAAILRLTGPELQAVIGACGKGAVEPCLPAGMSI